MTLDRIAHLVELGRWREAQALADALLAAEPDHAQALGYRTQCLFETGDLSAALASADRMVAISPGDPWAHRLRSVALGGLEQHRAALHAAAEAVRLAPHDWHCHLQYAAATVNVWRRRREAARAAARAVELAPDEPEAHLIVGYVAHRAGRSRKAKASYQRALALAPDHPAALNNLAALGGFTQVVAASRKLTGALQSAPQDAVARQNLDRVVNRFATLLVLVGAGAIVFAAAFANGEVSTGSAVLTALGLSIAVALWLALVVRRVPPSARRYALVRWRGDITLMAKTVVAAAALVTAYVVCFSPSRENITIVALTALVVMAEGYVAFLILRGLVRWAGRFVRMQRGRHGH